MQSLIGTGVALVTPFKKDFSVDIDALKAIVNFQIDNGIDYLVVLGTTAENATLSKAEKELVVNTIIDANKGRLPLVLGVGSNNTAEVVEELKSGNFSDFVAILSVSPYYNKPIQKGIVAHYKIVADSTDLPIILYNVPGRTGSNVAPETTLELAEVRNIVAVKEASGNMEQIMQIIKYRPSGFGVLSGDDNLTMPLIAAGADGVISVVANAFPALFSSMVHAAMRGELDAAREAHYKLFDVTKMFFEQGNPGGVKAALAHMELMDEFMRLPLFPVSDELRKRIEKETTAILG
jgi:4-hydroxy-tetrahydrodipicolinate synthase